MTDTDPEKPIMIEETGDIHEGQAPQTPEYNAITHVSSNSATPIAGLNLFNAADDTSSSDLSDDPAPFADRPLINKPLKQPEETFEPHPTDPTLIKANFKMRMPDGNGWYIQEDDVPEKRSAIASVHYGPKDHIFCPRLGGQKVPRKMKHKGVYVPWVPTEDVKTWTRTHPSTKKVDTFTAIVFFRRMHALTHTYEKFFFGEAKLNNLDPNNEAWASAYNKWAVQIARRMDADYVKEKSRDHWTPQELRAMYHAVNVHVAKKGVDSFAYLSEEDLRPITDAVNAAGKNNRGVDAVRGQFNSSHIGKNPTIHRLRIEGPAMAQYLEEGGILADDERYPVSVIPESEFPTVPRGNFIRNPSGNQKFGLTSGGPGKAGGVDTDGEDEPEVFTDESDSEAEVLSSDHGAGTHAEDEGPTTPVKKPKQSATHLAAAQVYLAGINSDSGENGDCEMEE